MNATIIMRGKSHRFRYIRAGIVNFDGPISNYRLISGNNLGDAASCIRFKLPNLFHMDKLPCDPYSTTDDTRSLNEIGYDILVKCNGRWVVRNDLKPIQPHKIYHAMMKEGKAPVKKLGYLTDDQYKAYCQSRDEKISKALESGQLPDEPEYADKYVLVWHNADGTIGWSLCDDEHVINLQLKTMRKIDANAHIIQPTSKKGANHA